MFECVCLLSVLIAQGFACIFDIAIADESIEQVIWHIAIVQYTVFGVLCFLAAACYWAAGVVFLNW